MCGGDFNAISVVDEKRGASEVYGRKEVSSFNQFIYEMNLVDLPTSGKKFTWFSGDESTKE